MVVLGGGCFLTSEVPMSAPPGKERETVLLLTTYRSRSTDVFGVPASRHGSFNPLFQVALYLPSWDSTLARTRSTRVLIIALKNEIVTKIA